MTKILRNFRAKCTNGGGFTLAELLIVVAIIAVMVAIAIPTFGKQLEKSREGTDISNLRAAYAAVASEAMLNPRQNYSLEVQLVQTKSGWDSDANIKIAGVALSDLEADATAEGKITVRYEKNDDGDGDFYIGSAKVPTQFEVTADSASSSSSKVAVTLKAASPETKSATVRVTKGTSVTTDAMSKFFTITEEDGSAPASLIFTRTSGTDDDSANVTVNSSTGAISGKFNTDNKDYTVVMSVSDGTNTANLSVTVTTKKELKLSKTSATISVVKNTNGGTIDGETVAAIIPYTLPTAKYGSDDQTVTWALKASNNFTDTGLALGTDGNAGKLVFASGSAFPNDALEEKTIVLVATYDPSASVDDDESTAEFTLKITITAE